MELIVESSGSRIRVGVVSSCKLSRGVVIVNQWPVLPVSSMALIGCCVGAEGPSAELAMFCVLIIISCSSISCSFSLSCTVLLSALTNTLTIPLLLGSPRLQVDFSARL